MRDEAPGLVMHNEAPGLVMRNKIFFLWKTRCIVIAIWMVHITRTMKELGGGWNMVEKSTMTMYRDAACSAAA